MANPPRRRTGANIPPANLAAPTPWWRVGMVWLVLGGPAAVVLAGVVTTVIAWQGSDPVVHTPPSTSASPLVDPATPAQQARNHVATSVR